MFMSGLQIRVECQVTHPPGTILDDQGNPVLDEQGNPLMMDRLRQEDKR